MTTVLELKGIKRHFGTGETKLEVLKNVNLEIKPGEVVALLGPSGSGKSTLLHIAGLLDAPSSGQITICGHNASKSDDNDRTWLRQTHMGFVYQAHLLLGDFTAIENVMMPMMIAKVPAGEAKKRAHALLERVGLARRERHRPGQLSGGEQQRVAIARALANNPKILLADEPTGNLDPETADGVFKELLKIVKETGLVALIATHNPELAAKMHRRITVKDGEVVEFK